ncbi:MAG: sugar transporter [Betaproteobacteria bacterium]|nr:MAG: sugar transporter [Betaproteobacteria bacterium]
MLRRSIAVIISCAAALAVAGCGIKGPLKLPPGQSAPAPTGLPPGAVPATTLPPKPPDTTTPPSDTPSDDKDQKQ